MATWLAVEDSEEIYLTLMSLFEIWETEGYGFPSFTDARKWIEEVNRGEFTGHLPELVILDIRLPDYDRGTMREQGGLILCYLMRKSPILKNITILLASAYHPLGVSDLTPLYMTEEGIVTAQGSGYRLLQTGEMGHLSSEQLVYLSGADGFISKPFPSPEEFKRELDIFIERRRTQGR